MDVPGSMELRGFIDGPQGKPSAGVHLLFAGEKLRAADEYPCPGLDESERAVEFQVVAFFALVRMKLAAGATSTARTCAT